MNQLPPPSHPSVASTAPRNELVAVLLRRWKYLLVCAVLGVVAGWMASRRFGQTTWTFASLLLYTPQQQAAPHYQPPDVGTLVALLKSPGVLGQVADEFRPLSARALGASLRVEAPYGSHLITLQLEAETPEKTIGLLNSLTKRVQRALNDYRRQALERAADPLARELDLNQSQLSAAVDALRRFQQAEQVVDFDRALEHARQEIAALEITSRTGVTREGVPTDDGSQRRALLRDLIQEEREAIQARSQLAIKRSEYDRAKALHERRYISDAEFQRIGMELQALTEQESGVVSRYREKLKQFDALAAARVDAVDPAAGRPPEAVATDLGGEDIRRRYEQLLQQRQQRLTHLLSVYPRATELADNVKRAAAQRERLETQLASVRQLRGEEQGELSVLQSPAPALDSTRTSTKKILVLTALMVVAAGTMPVFLYDLFLRRVPPQEMLANRHGLPALTRGISPVGRRGEASIDDQQIRRLALRIQQSTPADGRVVLFTSVNKLALEPPLLAHLAERLAQRGERVALVEIEQPDDTLAAWEQLAVSHPPEAPTDSGAMASGDCETVNPYPCKSIGEVATLAKPAAATTAEPRRCGLYQYLADRLRQPEDTCRPTAIAGVDVILSGEGVLPCEGLASRRMTDLIVALRRRYTTVLIAGPHASQAVDLQLLAARADAVVLVATGDKPPTPAASQSIDELIDAHAPLLGTVC